MEMAMNKMAAIKSGIKKHAKKEHPGFAAVQASIEKEGYGKKAAGAILASRTRHASASAKRANPNLRRVK